MMTPTLRMFIVPLGAACFLLALALHTAPSRRDVTRTTVAATLQADQCTLSASSINRVCASPAG